MASRYCVAVTRLSMLGVASRLGFAHRATDPEGNRRMSPCFHNSLKRQQIPLVSRISSRQSRGAAENRKDLAIRTL